jgi:hypothetical protein
MNKIQVYVHGENSRDPKLIDVLENASVKDIILAFQKEFTNTSNPEEIEIFLEDAEDPLQKDQSADKIGIKKRMHIHCHRCKKIAVTIFYNGEDKSFNFPPSATSKIILKKAIKAFNINEADAGDYLLKLDDKTILQPSDHVGSFVSFPHCQIKLFLTPTKPVQG